MLGPARISTFWGVPEPRPNANRRTIMTRRRTLYDNLMEAANARGFAPHTTEAWATVEAVFYDRAALLRCPGGCYWQNWRRK